MEIVSSKRGSLSIMALIFGIILIVIGIVELILVGMEESVEGFSIIFFTSPGDAVFETSFLDHIAKALISFLIAAVFLYGYPKIKTGDLEGFSFLIGGGILILGIGLLFISVWVANIIDISLQSIGDPAVWDEFSILDGIRIEWFLAIGAINIVMIWKKRDQYLQ